MTKDTIKDYLSKSIEEKVNIIKNHDSFKDVKIGEDNSAKIAKEVYLSSLKNTSITPEQIKELQEHDHEYFTAVAHLTGELGLDHLINNKDATKVSVSAALPGRSRFEAVISRKDVNLNPKTKEEITKYGSITTKLHTPHAKKDNGSISTVVAHYNKLALDKLAD